MILSGASLPVFVELQDETCFGDVLLSRLSSRRHYLVFFRLQGVRNDPPVAQDDDRLLSGGSRDARVIRHAGICLMSLHVRRFLG